MKQDLIEAMERRMKALNDELIRDFGASGQRLHEYREVKYWKEAIERGEFDVITERKPGYADLDD